jgi:hypothetical protein
MPIESIVNVSISLSSAGFPRTGYGTPLILSATTLFADRVRSYSSVAEMVTAGFSATGPECLAAGLAFAQTPRPRTVKIGRLANRPSWAVDLTPIAANSTVYAFEVAGKAISITSDGSATVAEIVTALDGGVDGEAISGLTSTDNTTKLTLSGAAGSWFQLFATPDMTTRLTVLNQTADPGVAADLAAIAVADNNWYWIINPWNSKAMIDAISDYAEANGKFFEACTQDSAVINTTLSGTDDVAEANASNLRTRLVYHPDSGAFMDAAEMGRIAPTNPGSASFSDKFLASVDEYELTSTQRANATAKNVGIYERIGAVGRTRNGKTLGGEWADKIIARDALVTNIQAAVYTVVSDGDKLPFTDEGIASVHGAIKGELDRGVADGVLAADPPPVVDVPLASEVSDADKAARTLTGVTFDAVLAGAIVAVTITGTLTD